MNEELKNEIAKLREAIYEVAYAVEDGGHAGLCDRVSQIFNKTYDNQRSI